MSTNDPRYGSQPGAQGPEGTQWSQPTPPEQPMQPPTGQPSSQPTVPTNPYAVPQPSQVPPAQQAPPPGQQPYMQGQQPYAQGAMGAVPPVGASPAKKSKTGLIVGILVAVAAVFIGGLMMLGFIVNSVMKDVETSSEPLTPTSPTTSSSTADPSTTSPSVSETIPLNQEATVGEWHVLVDRYTPNATADVADAYAWNEPAGPGNVYTMVHLTLTYQGSDGADGDYLFMDFDLVSESGSTISWFEGEANAVAKDDLFALETTLSPGQSVTGNILYEAPRDQTFTTFRVSDGTGQFVDLPLQ